MAKNKKNHNFLEEDEIATSGSPEDSRINALMDPDNYDPDTKLLKEDEPKPPEDPRVPPKIIKEARKLAGSRKGLDINEFFTKNNIRIELDVLLYGKLDKDGYLL